MVVEFSKIEEKTLPHYHGGGGELFLKMENDGRVKIMKGILPPGASVGMHSHETNCEIVYVVSGIAMSESNDVKEFCTAGNVCYCPKGQTHNLVNAGEEDLVFIAVVPEQ